ncbi:MAG: 30S ribosome-binding factor RbfA [Oscillospiraceae bacterium]|jgi:ribosome-binding factor A|nr:30S ribosome-binding factor RbfA [Oscillospiraceae bacterium]
MASARIGRINDDIQRILADRLRQVKDPRVSDQGMITITRVDTTGDLRYAKVWLSVYGLKDEKEFKKGLKSASGWLRRELGSALKLVYTPELVFEVDHSIEYGAKISGILDNLNIPELPEEEAEDWE